MAKTPDYSDQENEIQSAVELAGNMFELASKYENPMIFGQAVEILIASLILHTVGKNKKLAFEAVDGLSKIIKRNITHNLDLLKTGALPQ